MLSVHPVSIAFRKAETVQREVEPDVLLLDQH